MINMRDYRLDDVDDDDSGEWIVTFADLMALLLTFFVLLLSFSEINVQKYEELRERFNDTFSTVPLTSNSINLRPTITETRAAQQPVSMPPMMAAQSGVSAEDQAAAEAERLAIEAWTKSAEAIAEALGKDIKTGTLDVLNTSDQIIIRIKEEAVFDSGSAAVNPAFDHTLERIADAILSIESRVKVAGHTDNQAISSERFRSNWELSAARAVSVAHYMMEPDSADPQRFEVAGLADTQPLASNDTDIGRAANRRVEILLIKPKQPN